MNKVSRQLRGADSKREDHEVDIFCRYLIGSPAIDTVVTRYYKAITRLKTVSKPQNANVIFALKHPWSIGMLDGITALIRPQDPLRQRIYLLFAILEATPEYSDYFLPEERSHLYVITVILSGLGAACRVVGGLVVLQLARFSS